MLFLLTFKLLVEKNPLTPTYVKEDMPGADYAVKAYLSKRRAEITYEPLYVRIYMPIAVGGSNYVQIYMPIAPRELRASTFIGRNKPAVCRDSCIIL